MQADLKLSSSDYSLVLSIFFVVSGTQPHGPTPAEVPGLPPQRGPVQHDPLPYSPESVPAHHHVLLGESYGITSGPGLRLPRAGRYVDRSQGSQLARWYGCVQGEGLLHRHHGFDLTITVLPRHHRGRLLPRRHAPPLVLVQGELGLSDPRLPRSPPSCPSASRFSTLPRSCLERSADSSLVESSPGSKVWRELAAGNGEQTCPETTLILGCSSSRVSPRLSSRAPRTSSCPVRLLGFVPGLG
jgi:hypothetical protein